MRISPNEYSIDDPDAARIIYRTRDELIKVWIYAHLAISIKLLMINRESATRAGHCRA